jgi:hypothetical protein
MKITSIGMLLLAIWLILGGAAVFIPAIAFNGFANVMAALAIAAGVLILINK